MEYAFTTRGSGDLHVDLRDASARGGKYSAHSGAIVVFRFAAASGSRADREKTPLFFPVDHRCGLSTPGNASVVARSAHVAGWRARTPALADSVAARALSGRSDFHVIRVRGWNHHVVLPGVETGDGYGSSGRSSEDYGVADFRLARIAIAGYYVPRCARHGVSLRPIRRRVLAGGCAHRS